MCILKGDLSDYICISDSNYSKWLVILMCQFAHTHINTYRSMRIFTRNVTQPTSLNMNNLDIMRALSVFMHLRYFSISTLKTSTHNCFKIEFVQSEVLIRACFHVAPYTENTQRPTKSLCYVCAIQARELHCNICI